MKVGALPRYINGLPRLERSAAWLQERQTHRTRGIARQTTPTGSRNATHRGRPPWDLHSNPLKGNSTCQVAGRHCLLHRSTRMSRASRGAVGERPKCKALSTSVQKATGSTPLRMKDSATAALHTPLHMHGGAAARLSPSVRDSRADTKVSSTVSHAKTSLIKAGSRLRCLKA